MYLIKRSKLLNRSLSVLLAITIIFSSAYIGLGELDFSGLFAVQVNAASESDLIFELNDDGISYYVSGCDTSAEGELVIPSTYNGLPVTSIGYGAFSGCKGLTSVIIPNSVIIIGEYSFENCTNLTSITIPESVKIMDGFAFEGCTKFNSVYITNIGAWCEIDFYSYATNPMYYAENLYLNGELLTDVVIPEDITSIGAYTFYNCTSLASVTIPNSVTSIGNNAFSNCDSLTSITIPEGVTSIGDYTFSSCNNLTFVTIPESVTSIGFAAFYGCTNLTAVDIPDGVICINAQTFYFCTSLTSVSIPESVTSIGENAFQQCYNLVSIAFPDSVTNIGASAFSCCINLTSVSFPDSVTYIGDFAFESCENLTSVTIPDSLTYIGDHIFQHCTSLTTVTIGKGVTSIGDYTFWGCTNLTSIIIPDSVTSIGENAITSPTTIYCYEGSVAYDYAVNNTLDYTLINIHSVNNLVNIDEENKLIFSFADICTDFADIISTSENYVLNVSESFSVGNTKFYGTGSKVVVTSDGTVINEYTVITNGDTNGDSVCDVLDCFDVERSANGNGELTGAYAMAADSNSDDAVDMTDYQAIVNKVMS